MSELVCESPLRVSTSNLSYPMFAVNWPRGHVNTRVNKSMTTVSVIEDISDIVSISRGFMEYPPPSLHMLWRHCLNSVPAHSKPISVTVSVPLYSYMCFSKYQNHTKAVIYVTFKSMPWCQYRTYCRIVSILIQHREQIYFHVDIVDIFYIPWGLNTVNNLK